MYDHDGMRGGGGSGGIPRGDFVLLIMHAGQILH